MLVHTRLHHLPQPGNPRGIDRRERPDAYVRGVCEAHRVNRLGGIFANVECPKDKCRIDKQGATGTSEASNWTIDIWAHLFATCCPTHTLR